ncbi:MAG: DUF3520 domain-containing protein [Planctomycetaceae bacterium]|nr:DUF3520 domain-containing protein [Planctomycetaceae bacterium]
MKDQVGLTAEERAELVAWMLGEADVEVAERVQSALLQQPAWAAERERLEGVLGLLQTARPAGGEAAPEALLHEARLAASRRRGWRVLTRPGLLSAAASFAVLAGVWATGLFDGRFDATAPLAENERVAGLDRLAASSSALASDSQLTQEQLVQLQALGYYGGSAPTTPNKLADGRNIVRGDAFDAHEEVAAHLRESVRDLGYVGTGGGSGERHRPETREGFIATGDSDFFLGQGQRGPARGSKLASAGDISRGPGDPSPESGVFHFDMEFGLAPGSQGENLTVGVFDSGPPQPPPGTRAAHNDPALRGVGAWNPGVGPLPKEVPSNDGAVRPAAPFQNPEAVPMSRAPLNQRRVVTATTESAPVEHFDLGLPEVRVEDLLLRCRPMVGETADQYFLRSFGVRPFEYAATKPLATFAASVDTASYTHSRAYLDRGQLPPADLVRTEAFVNAFRREYADAAPEKGTFALHLELAPSPFGDVQRAPWLLRAAAVARHVAREERKPLALTFAVDVSGSMAPPNRLALVKSSLELLVSQLDSHDRVAIVAYSNDAKIVLPMTPASNTQVVLAAIRGLESGGSTNLDGGVFLAFQHAAERLDPELHSRVVLLSDGVGNVGATTRKEILARVETERKKGIYLNTIGVGMGDQNDALLDELARTGDGVASYVDDAAEARRAFVEDLVGTFETVARDVKLQMEFDPNQVGRYRLLGYESRALADRAFRDDTVDGGEVNAGHTVVALFELEDVRLGDGAPLATLRLVHKPPFGAPGDERSMEQALAISGREALGNHRSASPAFRLSAAAAQAAEMLRGSYHRAGAQTAPLLAELRAAARDLSPMGPLGAERAAEPSHLADRLEALAPQLDLRVARPDGVARLEADLRFAHFELALERETPGSPDPKRVAKLEARVAALEAELLERSR